MVAGDNLHDIGVELYHTTEHLMKSNYFLHSWATNNGQGALSFVYISNAISEEFLRCW